MRVLLVSDIHGNFEALDAVLEGVSYDRVVCLGDLVNYGPDPLAVIDWARGDNVPTIRGNHDNAVALHVDCGCSYQYKHLSEATREYTWGQITEKEEAFLMSLPLSLELNFDGVRLRAVHGSPKSFFDYISPDTPAGAVESMTEGIACDYLLAGHTHVPMIRQFPGFTVLNPGSVGQPRDGDPRTSCMVLDTATWQPEIIRLEYDRERTSGKIRAAMPHAGELIAILRRGY